MLKTVVVVRGAKAAQQFVLAPGEVLTIGRAPDCDVVVDFRGVSARHAELLAAAGAAEGAKDCAPDGAGGAACSSTQLCIRDCSTNGTGTTASAAAPWMPLRNGESRAVGPSFMHVLLPLNHKSKEECATLLVQIVGDGLPDAYDERTQAGRWQYKAKLGEGALGIVYCASDKSGRLPGEVAVKVCKTPRAAKIGAKLRHAYIMHREAQWSLQRLHNSKSRRYCPERAAHFARYLEDHTGRWAPELDFEAERTVFEAADFGWERFRPSPAPPACPYVVMELVPGRTLHQFMGWGPEPATDPPLSAEEKLCIARQLAHALEYLADLGLIHRDLRTTNLLLAGRGGAVRAKVIDLGHTVAAEPEQVRNRSAVVRCSWKESKVKHFDWAPAEVKEKDVSVNFAFPVHAFDIYSLGVLFLQLARGDLREARAVAAQASGREPNGHFGGVLGLDAGLVRRMLGAAAGRPSPAEVLGAVGGAPRPPAGPGAAARPAPAARQAPGANGAHGAHGGNGSNGCGGLSAPIAPGADGGVRPAGEPRGHRPRSAARSRGSGGRSRSRSRGSGGAAAAKLAAARRLGVEVPLDGDEVFSPGAVAYGSASVCSGSETEGSGTGRT